MASAGSTYLTDRYADRSPRMTAGPGMGLPALPELSEEWLPAVEPEGVTYAEVTAGAVPAPWCRPVDAVADRVLLHTHGGGLVAGATPRSASRCGCPPTGTRSPPPSSRCRRGSTGSTRAGAPDVHRRRRGGPRRRRRRPLGPPARADLTCSSPGRPPLGHRPVRSTPPPAR